MNTIKKRTANTQSINNKDILNRIADVYEYILERKTINEIATILGESEQTIYNDINIRLKSIGEARFLEIKRVFAQRRMDNLS